MEIKAIETEYNGYKFRSRLEARWAVFFDAAGIKYEYEPEGFELPDGTKYLPDFYLPEYDWHVEVKPPRKESGKDLEKASKFIGNKIKVLLLLGNIPPKEDVECWHYSAMYYNTLLNEVIIGRCCISLASAADQDPYTGLDIISWLGVDYIAPKTVYYCRMHPEEILTAIHDRELYKKYEPECCNDQMCWCDNFTEDDGGIQTLAYPYEKARQARFEYGETPEVKK